MARDYVLLQQDEGEGVVKKQVSSGYLPWLPLTCTILLTIALAFLFGIPSTLFAYLAFLIVYSTSGILSLAGTVFIKSHRLIFTPTMAIAIALLVLPLCFSNSNNSTPILKTSQSQQGVLFVAANLYNSESILTRFTSKLIEMAESIGNDNIFISIYESNSKDDTKSILTKFDEELSRLHIPHHIKMENTHNHIGVWGNFDRIAFLAGVRNKVYEALEVEPGINYKSKVKKVLWLNDILFDSSDALKLLNTNNGDFDVACAVDHIPLGMYDTWVLRDMNLNRAKPLWPYFQDPNDVKQIRRGDPIRVRSCWNGMAAFNADLLIDGRPKPFKEDSSKLRNINPNDNVTWPLRFRDSGPCLTSECLSLNYDLHRMLAHDREPQIYINPNIHVAYEQSTFYLYNRILTWRIVAPWHVIWEDWIANRMFWFITDIGRKKAECNNVLTSGFHSYRP